MNSNKEKKEYVIILKDRWEIPTKKQLNPKQRGISHKWLDEELANNKNDKPQVKLNNDVILKYLYEYVNDHFDQFGHYVPIGNKFESWWHHHKYGTSYQPIVQMCYVLKGQELGFTVREHHAQKRITELASGMHGIKYDRETKMKSYNNIDVCWGDDDHSFTSNELTLAFEYEDSGKLDELFEELYKKLIHIDSKFTVLGTRLNYEPDVIVKNIEEKLKRDNITKPLIFIFIAPDSLSNPSKICFSEYFYQNAELKKVDDNKYFINIVSKKTPDGIIIEKVK